MTAYKSIYGQAFRLLCLVAFMAIGLSIFAQDAQKPWSILVAERKQEIDRELPHLSGKTIIIGDSHASFLALTANTCATPVVNAGVNGATSKRYLELIETLKVTEKARTAVVSIGTNDILRKRATSASDFRTNADRIIRAALRISENVIVSAIPPISLASSDLFDDAKGFAFSNLLRDECERHARCTYSEPHRIHRDAERPGAGDANYLASDGIHLADYAVLSARLGICPSHRSAESGIKSE